ncbi:MAG: hypothetical protein PHZ00_07455 [Candidatus Peribacteraceae bacterium]|nr:hypothetical protein [Candidatus Peribacteraceae bacterium]
MESGIGRRQETAVIPAHATECIAFVLHAGVVLVETPDRASLREQDANIIVFVACVPRTISQFVSSFTNCH